MGVINSDLKHQLDNVHYIDAVNEIWFPKPLKVTIKNLERGEIEYICIKKVGRIIKLCTVNDCITLSNAHFMLQWYLYRVLLSMKDPRYPFDYESIYELESILAK